jgi:hypothetical protein
MHDGAIAVRVWIDRDRAFSGGNVIVPRLDPIQLDWTRSRPLERWYIGPMTGQHYEWNGEKKQIYLLELATADLKIVCSQHAGRRKNPSSNRKSAELFVKEHLERNPDATLDSVREAAKSTFGREVVDRAYRRQRQQNTGSAVKRGPRPKSPTPNSAEK